MRQDKKVAKRVMRQDRKVAKRVFTICWWKAILGAVLIGVGLIAGTFYVKDPHNLGAGMLAALAIAPGGFLVYFGLKQGEQGFAFSGKGKRYRGDENAIVLFARHNNESKKDIPLEIKFVRLEQPPKGARLHYVRNLNKHFYELFNNPKTRKLEPVQLPDKKSFPPELYKIPATMQPYKDYMDYSPPTMLQKVAPGVLLGAMGLVGLLMVITGG